MRYRMNLLLWTTDVTESHWPMLERPKAIGYDIVEVPVFETKDAAAYARLGARLRALGLLPHAVTALGPEANIASAAAFARRVAPDAGVLYDTFHAHIEEKDVASAIAADADRIALVHVSENDRSTPGRGHVRWRETFAALKAAGYQGPLIVEAFGLALPALSAATRIWRRMFDDEFALAEEALAFMKRQWEAL